MKFLIGLSIISLVVCVVALFGFVAMLLWNALMPAIFQLPVIGFWQALGLLVLSRMFFMNTLSMKTESK
ncbi:MAG: hypothetical protein LBC02_00990 [Planctomycetaceae bacterium]|jgi:hypothetical protein|nr:hypothetical protein [Planctomycetaceae bacterium]